MIMYETIIGLEVHVELKTQSKIFCGCSTRFGAEANSQVCPICLGMPGVLPVLNKKVLEYAVLAGLSLECQIAEHSKMDRKNYFYPDLPKAYQISQYDLPICGEGFLTIKTDDGDKKITINRVHIEEDTGKLTHQGETISTSKDSLVDFNRGGVPLIEIVSEPEMKTPMEAVDYLEKLKSILQYLNISDCKMEEGSLRCDANVSLRPLGDKKLGCKTEIKNLNSFKMLQRALEFEIKRQDEILRKGGKIVQETRTWDDKQGITLPLRSKEMAHDYRYFPEPDLVLIRIKKEWLQQIKNQLPELPQAKKKRFIEVYQLPAYDAEVLTGDKDLADFFEETLNCYPNTKKTSNWIMSEVLRLLNQEQIAIKQALIKPKEMAGLLKLVDDGVISSKIAKEVFIEMFATGSSAEMIIENKGLSQISDKNKLEEIITKVLNDHPDSVKSYYAGQKKNLGFLVGQVMKETAGQANPAMVNEILFKKLGN